MDISSIFIGSLVNKLRKSFINESFDFIFFGIEGLDGGKEGWDEFKGFFGWIWSKYCEVKECIKFLFVNDGYSVSLLGWGKSLDIKCDLFIEEL